MGMGGTIDVSRVANKWGETEGAEGPVRRERRDVQWLLYTLLALPCDQGVTQPQISLCDMS